MDAEAGAHRERFRRYVQEVMAGKEAPDALKLAYKARICACSSVRSGAGA
jgi:hypothetical protein